MRVRKDRKEREDVPVIVPCTTDPFFNSMVTVSLFNFIKKLEIDRAKQRVHQPYAT